MLLLCLILAALACPQLSDAVSELNITAAVKSIAGARVNRNVTFICGLRSPLSGIKLYRISVQIPGEKPILWEYLAFQSPARWLCNSQSPEFGSFKACKANGTLIISGVLRQKNAGQVICSVVAVADGQFSTGRRIEVTKQIEVVWQPSVGEVRVGAGLDASSKSALREFQEVTVSCSVNLGNPAVPLSTVRAFVGETDLGPPVRIQNLSTPKRQMLLTWRFLLSHGDNGAKVGCRIGSDSKGAANSTKLLVQYPPSITELEPSGNAAILLGEHLRCTSDASPVAYVVLSAHQKGRTRWQQLARGFGLAEVAVNVTPGLYSVRCQAANLLGVVAKTERILILEKPPKVTLRIHGPVTPAHRVPVTCSTEATTPFLQELQLLIPSRSLIISRAPANTSCGHVGQYKDKIGYWRAMDKKFFEVYSVVVEDISGRSNHIATKFHVRLRDHGTEITCRAIGVKGNGINASVSRTFDINYKPSLGDAYLCMGSERGGNEPTWLKFIFMASLGKPPGNPYVSLGSGKILSPKTREPFCSLNGRKMSMFTFDIPRSFRWALEWGVKQGRRTTKRVQHPGVLKKNLMKHGRDIDGKWMHCKKLVRRAGNRD